LSHSSTAPRIEQYPYVGWRRKDRVLASSIARQRCRRSYLRLAFREAAAFCLAR
jgi:hypothetical protein